MRRALKAETIERISAAQTSAEVPVLFALDHFRQNFRQQFSEMLKGNPYSQIAMDTALENIMRIALEEEAHQNYGEIVEAEETSGDYCIKQDGDEYKILDIKAREIVHTCDSEADAKQWITDHSVTDWMREPTDAQLRDIEAEQEISKIDEWLPPPPKPCSRCNGEGYYYYYDTPTPCEACRGTGKQPQPKDPRTPAQRDLDDWQADASDPQRR